MTESWTIATRPEIRWGVARWSMFRDSGVTFGVFTIAYLVQALGSLQLGEPARSS